MFVNTKQQEFDYPAGDDERLLVYTGSGGVRGRLILLRRALFAGHFGSSKILLSSDITRRRAHPVLPQYRRARETALPFLGFDRDPYMS